MGNPPQVAEGEKALIVGTTGDYAPFSWTTPTGFDGLDIALATEIARQLGRPLRLKKVGWGALDLALEDGRCDLLMSGITITEARAQRGLFTRPYLRNRTVLLGRPGEDHAESLARGLSGCRLGVNRGGYLERTARARFPLAELCTIGDNTRLAHQLVRGDYDLALSDALEARHLMTQEKVLLVGDLEFQEHAVYLGRTQQVLRDDVDRIVGLLVADGTLSRLAARYGIDHELMDRAAP